MDPLRGSENITAEEVKRLQEPRTGREAVGSDVFHTCCRPSTHKYTAAVGVHVVHVRLGLSAFYREQGGAVSSFPHPPMRSHRQLTAAKRRDIYSSVVDFLKRRRCRAYSGKPHN